jgi:two-component system chemotaxis response regulator CheY
MTDLPAPPPRSKQTPTSGVELVVLVADPNPAIAQKVEEALAGLSVRILSARSKEDALQQAEGQDLGLVLASASLQRGSGYDLARVVRERWPAAAVVLMTGGFEVYARQRAEEAGVTAHLIKPFSPESLRAVVSESVGPISAKVAAPPVLPPPPAALPPRPELPPVIAAVELLPEDPGPASPPISAERVASFLPRDHARLPRVAVDPEVVGPAMERAILEVLPEVVEAVLRSSVGSSTAFRELVRAAVQDAVRVQLPELAGRIVRERLAEIEAAAESLED